MVRLFKHYVPHTVLLLGLIDFVLLMVAGEAGWVLRMWQIESNPEASVSRLPELLTFAITLQLSMVGSASAFTGSRRCNRCDSPWRGWWSRSRSA